MGSKWDTSAMLGLGLAGAVLGGMLGLIAGIAYIEWWFGRPLDQVGFDLLLTYRWVDVEVLPRPYLEGLGVALAVLLALTAALMILGIKRVPTSHGDAAWATRRQMHKRGLLRPLGTGVPLAKLDRPKTDAPYVVAPHDRRGQGLIPHVLVAAPTGSGKGVGVVIPTLLTHPGSVVCLDVKSENYFKTARKRAAAGDTVYRFAPYEEQTHRYNPLTDVARLKDPGRQWSELRRLATSFISLRGENAQAFLPSARELWVCLAMFALEQRGEGATLGDTFRLLGADSDMHRMLKRYSERVRYSSAQEILRTLAGTEGRILGAYVSVLKDGGLAAWSDPAVDRATSATDFDLTSFRRRPTSLYLCVGPNDFEALGPVVRLLVQQLVAILQRREPDMDEPLPVLIMLDEFVSLGKFDVLEQAITTLRSYGGRLVIIVQSLPALYKLYGRDAGEVFIGNCDAQLFLAPNDERTPDYISKAIGDHTQVEKNRSWRAGQWSSQISERETGSRLIRSEQVRRLEEHKVVVLVRGMPPIIAHRLLYYEDRKLKPLHDAQRGPHPEAPPAVVHVPTEADLMSDAYGVTIVDGTDDVDPLSPADEPEAADLTTGDRPSEGDAASEETNDVVSEERDALPQFPAAVHGNDPAGASLDEHSSNNEAEDMIDLDRDTRSATARYDEKMKSTNDRLSPAEVEAARERRVEMQHLQEIEGNPLSPDQIAMFEMFEREGWSHERRLAYIKEKACAAGDAHAAE